MFFGAGNLIFPPFLGAQAGSLTWHAMGGFLMSAVGLPVLGVAAVALSGGLPSLAKKVHPVFAFVFTLLKMCIRDSFTTILVIAGNLVADILYSVLDPRIREGA